jgi:hypothetical protein
VPTQICSHPERLACDFTSSRSMLRHLRGLGCCPATAGDSRSMHRVWVGRCPAELVIKSSPGPRGWRQSSHSSAEAFPGSVAGLSNCGGTHAEVFPNITRQVTGLFPTASMLDRLLSSGRAHSSVFPKTNRHEQWDVASAAITTSGAGANRIQRLRRLVQGLSTLAAKLRESLKAREQCTTTC